MLVTQGLRRASLIRPQTVATIEGMSRRTWSEVADRVARFAAGLRSLGLTPGDRVAILALNSAAYFESLFAIPWAGGVAVPINTRLALAEIDFILADSGAKFLLVDETMSAQLANLRGHSLIPVVFGENGGKSTQYAHEALIAENARIEDALRGGDDLAGIYYTGGTTGKAKGVMLSHANLVSNALNVIICVGYERDTVYLHAPPMFHLADGCSTFGVTIQGGTHVFMPRFDPEMFLRIAEQERITDVTLVPTMINMIIHHPGFSKSDLSRFKRIFFGASPMPDGVLRRALELLPHVKFQQAWGMTELSPIATVMDARFTVLNSSRLRSCGQPVPTVEIRIVDGNGQEVPRGTIGEIAVRGPTVMQGYWNQPESTAAVRREGWLFSGDGGYMDDEGFVYIVDRLKDMIVTGGENVYSAEVENAISLMEAVAEVAVIGIPDPRWGEAVHAIVVPRKGLVVTAQTVIDHCKARIASYKCPRSVEIRQAPLPLSAANKILKTELRAPYWKELDRAVN